MLILVTGAAGFIGKRLCGLLQERAHKVRALVRDAGKLPAGTEPALGDLRDPESLLKAVTGTQAVVHLAALKSDESDIYQVNVDGSRALVEACRSAGVTRLVNVSTQATRIGRRGDYGESKARADELIMTAGLRATTLIPSLVYGPDDPGVFGKLAGVVRSMPVVPVFGDGTTFYRPIHVDDFCSITESCLRLDATVGKTYDVGGPAQVSFDGMVDGMAAHWGLKRLKLHVPGWAALALAHGLRPFFYRPPLSVSNMLGALYSAEGGDYEAIVKATGIEPRSFAAGIKELLHG
ncbi:MAG: NAD-dependent epimerase/dehydratase family protein [Elusimicrobia bacterium]|nr:NAD-dependent epimerase/dehydratase family protein [Elusimicrobiota bacterium]